MLVPIIAALAAIAQAPLAAPDVHIGRAVSPIRIDGDLSDAAWRTATRVDKWYEVQPGDNVAPPVKSVGYLAYDDRFLYAAFEFDDPEPARIRAPLGDHDTIDGASMDFGGLFIDSLNTGRAALELFVTPRNVQFDAVTDDATGENASPDFFWDSAAAITGRGWTVEMRIPFSTLRYHSGDPQQWRIILFRNYPRSVRRQIMSVPIPRGSVCLVCRASALLGLEHLPSGRHVVAAPYVSASEAASPAGGVAGAALVNGSPHGRAGLDLKYDPNAETALDATVRPDFSQIESDTAQISANERFALFFPEKRPFFLEGVDLLQTPIQAVYTRTITDPAWGGRITGKAAGVRYIALVARDSGGGTAVIPESNGSSSVSQDFASTVVIGRARRDVGRSFVGALLTDREAPDEGSHNRVVGPDFEWRPSSADIVAGQWLFSDSRTPDHPELAREWNGRRITGDALAASWTHTTRHLDWFGRYNDVTGGFRADTGFVPQAGFRETLGSTGWSVYPGGPITRARTFVSAQYQAAPSGAVITENVQPGVELNTPWSGNVRVHYAYDRTRAGDALIARQQIFYTARFSPSRRVALVAVSSTMGQDIDFDNARPATGFTIDAEATLDPTDHLAIDALEEMRSLHVGTGASEQRLLVQRVSRVKATYSLTSRMFVRAIGQYVATTKTPSLYAAPVQMRGGEFSGSALFAYKVNWQSVVFVGYGDTRELTAADRLQPTDRQFFVKVSYAFQR